MVPDTVRAVGWHEGQQGLNKSAVDVVVADDEDICRAAAASALKRFGFARVHEVENGIEALQKVTALQNSASAETRVPVIVFLDLRMPGSCGQDCARQICDLFGQRQLPREPFLVCASARRATSRNTEQIYFHCTVPKTFESSKLEYCFDLCQHWWMQGGGQPGRVSFSPQGKQAPLPPQQLPVQQQPPQRQPPPAEKQRRPRSPRQPRSSGAAAGLHLPLQAASAPKVVPLVAAPCPAPTPIRGGNSIESLDSLLPPRPPFEDVEMLCLVGRGSFGRVYRARWDASTVALKIIEHYDQGKPAMMAFEGALSTNLAHPNLVQSFKYSIRDMKPVGEGKAKSSLRGFEVWIVQEWCSLGTLNQKLSKKEMLEQGGFNEVIEVSAEIGSAASYLHSRGIIHGDLTANNVLLVERRCPKGYTTKVTDFGLARVLDNGMSGINTATMGTVTYMPPELFQLEGCALTKKVDVYAFGVIIWQLCTGGTPFEGLQPTQVVVMVAQGATLQLPHNVPEPLARVFKLSVSRKPSERPGFDRIVLDLLAIADFEDEPEHSERWQQ